MFWDELTLFNYCHFSYTFNSIWSSQIRQNAGVGDIISSVKRACLGKLNVDFTQSDIRISRKLWSLLFSNIFRALPWPTLDGLDCYPPAPLHIVCKQSFVIWRDMISLLSKEILISESFFEDSCTYEDLLQEFKASDVSERNVKHSTFFPTKYTLPRFRYCGAMLFSRVWVTLFRC